ncbi:hypothetical protein [Nitrosopumilus sp.]|uniref:hypothetical protein n=1 Tax=Nitrosopumilus sp. TaxID=2024843 RepID=UPI00292F7242|nr:hypothetical protein [Nitrosopumilus sp.]
MGLLVATKPFRKAISLASSIQAKITVVTCWKNDQHLGFLRQKLARRYLKENVK